MKSSTDKNQVFTFFCSNSNLARRNGKRPHAQPWPFSNPNNCQQSVDHSFEAATSCRDCLLRMSRRPRQLQRTESYSNSCIAQYQRCSVRVEKQRLKNPEKSEKLRLRHFFEIKTLTTVRKEGSNLKTILNKKQSPAQKQTRKNKAWNRSE